MDKQNKCYSQLADMAKEYSQQDLVLFKTQGLGKIFFSYLEDTVKGLQNSLLVGFESCSIDREIEKVKQMQVQAYTLNSLLQLDLDTIKEFYEGEKEREQYSE